MRTRLTRWLAALVAGVTCLVLSAQEPPVKGPIKGKVIETMSAGGYTYLQVQQGKQKIWVATEARELKQGVQVEVPQYWAMKDFKSKTLERTFEWIMFASKVYVEGEKPTPTVNLPQGHPSVPGVKPAQPKLPEGHPSLGGGAAAPAKPKALQVKPGAVKPLKDGQTVEQCFKQKDKLGGKEVKIRGIVVKYMPDIMGANWLHLRDGTGKVGTDDLVVTTKGKTKVGDLVVVSGKLTYDKNIGSGYRFAAIMEGAKVRVEKSGALLLPKPGPQPALKK